MFIIKPYIFNRFPEIISAVSTKVGLSREAPFCFNLSENVGDDKTIVSENRKIFFELLGLDSKQVVYQNQIHSDIITVVEKGENCGESDALITSNQNLTLIVTIADCVPILLYDPIKKLVGAVHSGWKGTANKILLKTINKLQEQFGSSPEDLVAYIGPSISPANYEVGIEVADQFDKKYVMQRNEKLFLDVSNSNYDMLIECGVKKQNIQKSELCTFEMKNLFHSYRRDGNLSGRSFAVICLKDENAK